MWRVVDGDDVMALVGLGMLFGGLWWYWPPAALMVIGGILLVIGLAGAWRRGRERPPYRVQATQGGR